MADKQSKEKVDALRAVGAEVVVCPTNVEPSDPRSYYSTAKRIAAETPNSFYPNQYDNLSNFAAHYESTGPEIWNQTEGRVTHYVAGLGTGGTLCGTGKYLKEQNPNVQVIGIDTYGSVLKKYKETGIFDENEIYPYMVEGIGEDFIPKNIDFDVIDHIIKVTDKDSAIMARRLAREESLFIGWSCGAAVYGALEYARKHLKPNDIMVILLPDHGTRYLAKIYNDTWMKDHGFMENREFGTAKDIIQSRGSNSKITTVDKDTTVQEVISIMAKEGISQIPVTDGEHYIGSLNESKVLYQLLDNPEIKKQPVKEIMEKPFKFVGMDYTIDALSSLIDKDNKAVLVRDEKNEVHIITQADLLAALAK
jgi:cystathionine beta-synthase